DVRGERAGSGTSGSGDAAHPRLISPGLRLQDVGRFRAMASTDEMDRLLDLQERDSALDRLRSRRVELESGEEARRLRAMLEDVERTLGELRLANDAVSSEQRRLENEIDSVSRKAEAEQKRLYDGTIVNVKELDALQAEIRSLGER